jgi:hypothetical protein
MIGVDVGVDDVSDGDLGLLGFLDEPGLIAGDYVHGNGLAPAAAAEKIG